MAKSAPRQPSAAKSGTPAQIADASILTRRRRRDPSGRGRRCAGADDAAGHAGRRRPEFAARSVARGPTALEDFHFREKIFHFDHERIPERVVHARGYGAHGYFENYKSLADITRADLFQRAGRKDAGLRALLDRGRQQGLGRPGARRARLRGQALHQGRQLGPRRQQHPGLLHPGRDQVSRPDPCRQAGARPRLSAGADRARQFLGLHLADPGKHRTWRCGSCPTARSRARSASWKASASTPSGWSMPRANRPSSSSTGSRSSGMQSVVWNEAVKINGADPDFHRRDLWDAIQMRRLPGMGTGAAAVRRGFRRQIRLRRARCHQDHPGGGGAGAPRRPAGARSRGRQFLRRDRAGRVLHAEHRARHRLHQRPAAAGPQLLLSRHAAEAARQPQLHPSADQRAEMPVPPLPAGRPHGVREPEGPRELRAEFLGRRRGRTARGAGHRASRSFPAEEEGPKLRVRAETFADHYSQARQFYLSQTPVEQSHIAAAFIFELSKVETPAIRARMVSHLLNVDEALAKKVADGLRLKELPKAAEPARPVVTGLPPSPALSILGEPAGHLQGPQARRAGQRRRRCRAAASAASARFKQEGAVVKLVAPMVGGVEASDGSWIAADEKIDGGPSVRLRRGRDPAVGCRRAIAGRTNRRRAISSPMPSPIANSSAIAPPRCRCWTKPGLPRHATAA